MIAVIINPVSGGARPDAARARIELAAAVLERAGERGDIFVTDSPGHARSLAQLAMARRARLVMAWGGDGTINEVASTLAFGDVPLGIIAAGSGNGLATELGVNRQPERALLDALRATPRAIDLGEISGRLFVNAAGIGIDAYVAVQFNDAGNRRRGFRSYLSIGTRALFRYQPLTYRISSAHGRTTSRAVLIAVTNGTQYGNGARIAPGARLDDGELDLVVVEEKSRAYTILRTPRLFTGTIGRASGVSMQRVREVTIECEEPIVFQVDGEALQGGTSLTAKVHPAALKICVK